MAISSLRLPLTPWLAKPRRTHRSFGIAANPKIPLNLTQIYQCSPSPSTLEEPTESQSKKWETFMKKKVALRVGYVGTEYRGSVSSYENSSATFYFRLTFSVLNIPGLQMQRNEHSLSSKFLYLSLSLALFHFTRNV